MKKTLTLFTCMFLLGKMAFAQQEPMFTKYMFNSLVYNPGYAGSKDYLSVGLIHRSQWLGEIDGAPITQSFTAHTPLRNQRVGVGFSVVNDIIGPSRTTGANLSYAYRIPMGKYKFSVGLQGGVDNYNANYQDVVIDDPNDQVFQDNVNFVLPNFGMGLFFYGKSFYAGVSSPKLIEYALGEEIPGGPQIYARAVRHFYFMTGAAIPVKGDAVVFKPSFVWRNVGADKRLSKLTPFQDIGAPNEFQVDLSLLFHQSLWVGTSFNSAFSIDGFENPPRSSVGTSDFWVSYVLKNGLRIGAAYSYSLTKLNRVTSGSMEFMLGYEFDFRENKVITPRYF
ncbi:MAG: type IX secretion system membrane protein PorP/SprF [Saprospiraceae bacterium]|jgi:type IX secretion system PorP/SprF family membrane protein|nr:type IX secretion system membrane protein PorP/SprF [Saprospiraceae bacterium]